MLKIIEDLPHSQTDQIIHLIVEKQARIKYFHGKTTRFIHDIVKIMTPLIFFENE